MSLMTSIIGYAFLFIIPFGVGYGIAAFGGKITTNPKPIHPALAACYYLVQKGNPALRINLKHTIPYTTRQPDIATLEREYDSPQSRN